MFVYKCHKNLLLYSLLQLSTMASISKKVVAVGDVGCGKTSLLNVFSTGNALDVNTPHTLENEVTNVIIDDTLVSLSLCSTGS